MSEFKTDETNSNNYENGAPEVSLAEEQTEENGSSSPTQNQPENSEPTLQSNK